MLAILYIYIIFHFHVVNPIQVTTVAVDLPTSEQSVGNRPR